MIHPVANGERDLCHDAICLHASKRPIADSFTNRPETLERCTTTQGKSLLRSILMLLQ